MRLPTFCLVSASLCSRCTSWIVSGVVYVLGLVFRVWDLGARSKSKTETLHNS